MTLSPGGALVVDFGEINPSVGDACVITREPDADEDQSDRKTAEISVTVG